MPVNAPRQALRPTFAATIVLATVAAMLGWIAPPAAAAVGVNLKAGSGTVGVSQNVTATVSSTASGAPTGKVTLTADGKTVGARAVGGDQGTSATFAWVPTVAGPVTLRATFDADSGDSATTQLTVQVNLVATTTTLTVPATAPAASTASLTAAVRVRSGTYVPTGTVAFRSSNGTTLGTAPLDATGVAALAFTTPSTTTTLTLTAEYSGDARALGSTSGSATLRTTAASATLRLNVPATARVGASTDLLARISPSDAVGSVSFTADGVAIGTAKLSGGTARVPWTPTSAGSITITATYPGGGGVAPATAAAKVRVDPALAPDAITISPGDGTAPWNPATPAVLPNGARVELQAASTSRLPVQLTVSGPCALAANTLVVKGVGAPCVLVATTKGNGTYAPASQTFTVRTTVGRQSATLPAPPSGAVRRHTALRLGRIGARTDVGQPITWRVTTGRTRCHIARTAGSFRLVLTRSGTCRVRATAPAVPGQWAPFSAYRTYRIR